MNGRAWTTDELGRLRKWHADGVTYRVIAQRLGRLETVVGAKARELGLTRQPTQKRATTLLADEIAAARREAPTAPLFRPGDRL